MRLQDLAPAPGAKKSRNRLGRGSGSGHGNTSGKGFKGQKQRSGGGTAPWFEGGQMPLQRRIPKRGFKNHFKTVFTVINIGDLERFESGARVGVAELLEVGLVRKILDGVKLLGDGEIDRPLTVQVHKASVAAIQKIEAAGGKVELLITEKRA